MSSHDSKDISLIYSMYHGIQYSKQKAARWIDLIEPHGEIWGGFEVGQGICGVLNVKGKCF